MFIKNITVISRYWILLFSLQIIFGADDSESWNSIGFQVKLPHAFKIDFEQELRFQEQFSKYKQTFTEVSISYKILDGFRVFIPFRYTIGKDDNIKKRLSLGSSYKYNFKNIALKYRFKYQETYEQQEIPEELIRNKLSFHYDLTKKIEPYFSGEVFYPNNTSNYNYDEYRFSFGIVLDLPKKNELKVFFTYKVEDIHKTNPDHINVFGLAYNYQL